MKIIALFKQFSLPISLLIGISFYLLFSRVNFLIPMGDILEPYLVQVLPILLFCILFVTFCKVEIKEMRPRKWHFILQAIRILLSGLLVVCITLCKTHEMRLILEGIFVCVICPTAAAAPVVAEKLGGSVSTLTTFTLIANGVTSVIIPLFFPMVEKESDITFLTAALAVLRNVTFVLLLPLVLAQLCKRFTPTVCQSIVRIKNLGFYMWCINLAIVSGITLRNILSSTIPTHTLYWLLIAPLFVALTLFTIGKKVGGYYGDRISAGQALGQKNTVVGIWLTVTFLNPLVAVAPGAYVLWQNLINGWQLWYKEKYGRLKW